MRNYAEKERAAVEIFLVLYSPWISKLLDLDQTRAKPVGWPAAATKHNASLARLVRPVWLLRLKLQLVEARSQVERAGLHQHRRGQ